MNKIIVQLPVNRDYAGKLEIQNAAGKRIAGPFRVCGRADDESAANNKNPRRDPLLPFGDIPFGEYQIVKILPSGPGTAYRVEEFGSAGIVLMRPRLGDAALADANGRFGFFIQGGAKSRKGLLRPTLDGSLRLSDSDQRKFISALRKTGDDSFCLVVCTAKLGAKVAVAKVPPKSRRNTSASLLLASSVIASMLSGIVRQAWIRTMFNTAGSAVVSGVAFVAADHASAQQTGDYQPTGAMDQLNATEQHGQNATHATTDEQAHSEASQGFDTSTTETPPVYLNNDHQVVEPNAASGNLPPASAAGVAPGSPIVAPEPSTTTEETPTTPSEPTATPTETQPAAPENQTTPQETPPPENTTAPETTAPQTAPAENPTPETTPATAPEETQPATSDNNQPHLQDSLPGIYLNDTTGKGNETPYGIPGLPGTYVNGPRDTSAATGPSETQMKPLDQIENGVRAPEGTAPAETTQPNNAMPPEATPSANPAPENQTMPEATPSANPAPENQPAETPAQPPAQEELKNAVAEPPAVSTTPGSESAPENQTAPATEPAPPSSVPSLGAAAPAAAAGAAAASSIAAPTAQEPASQAIIEHDKQIPANPTVGAQQIETGKEIPPALLNEFKNRKLKNWVVGNVTCANQPVPNKYGISAGNSGELLVTSSLFEKNSPATNANLMAFELGKVYWLKHTDAAGNAPSAMLNLLNNQTLIKELRTTKYNGVGLDQLTSDSIDGASQFGVLFRAALLNLQPQNRADAKDWKALRAQLLKTVNSSAPKTTVP